MEFYSGGRLVRPACFAHMRCEGVCKENLFCIGTHGILHFVSSCVEIHRVCCLECDKNISLRILEYCAGFA